MGELRIKVRGGLTICVPDAFANLTTSVLLEQETWFEDEFGFARACLHPGECAVDVGANFGLFTTALAASAGPAGTVIAVEPAAATASYLRSTVAVNGQAQVQIVQAALSDRAGHGTLALASSPELNTLVADADASRVAHAERVPLLRLDDVLQERGIDEVALLKIDAEGHELEVGRGAERTLRTREPLVMFEIKHGDTVEFRLLDYLEGLGYKPWRLIPGLGMLAPFRREDPVDPYQLNLFACTDQRARLLAAEGLLAAAPAKLPRQGAGLGAHAAALDGFSALQTKPMEPDEELATLLGAHASAQRALGERRSVPRLLTYARLCRDLGHRRAAVATLHETIGIVQALAGLTLDEECLAPDHRYTEPPSGTDAAAWVQSATVEAFIRLCAFSSVFHGPPALPMLEYLRARPHYSAEMERRRQIVRLCNRLQPAPEPHPLLAREAEDNLNPRFWSGEYLESSRTS